MRKILGIFTLILAISIFTPIFVYAELNFDEYGIKDHELISSQMEVIEESERSTLSTTWATLPSQSNVDLNKEWTITFSGGTVSLDKIAGIVIEKNGVFSPVKIQLFPAVNQALVTPLENYLPNETYTVRTFLENGLRYKMTFTTKNEITSNEFYGNSSGNISNKGLVAEYNDWIYYSNHNDLYRLYKVKKDGTEKTRLSDQKALYINVMGGWVYFKDDHRLYRVRTDGTEFTMLDDSAYGHVMVGNDGWIYYTSSFNVGRINYDGKNSTYLVTDYFSVNPIIDNNDIYFTYGRYPEYTQLRKYNLDSKTVTPLTKENISHLNIHGDFLYYINLEKQKIYKLSKDGLIKNEFISDWAESLNIYNDWIYYVNSEDRYIYRVKLDGSQKQNVNTTPSTNINIISDWIYYEDPTTNKFYRMKHNGANWQEVQ